MSKITFSINHTEEVHIAILLLLPWYLMTFWCT